MTLSVQRSVREELPRPETQPRRAPARRALIVWALCMVAASLPCVGLAGCGPAPQTPGGSDDPSPPAGGLGTVRLVVRLPDRDVPAARLVPAATRLLRVTVTATDISPAIMKDFPLDAGHGGTQTLQVSVPSGTGRTVDVEAFDDSSPTRNLLAQASTTVDVIAAQITQCSVTLQPEGSIFPTVSATAMPATCLIGEIVTFGGSASDSDGAIALYEWDMEDDGTYDWSSTTGPGTTHTYSTVGTHTARLRVTDNDGLQSTATVTVAVSDGTERLSVSPTLLSFRDDLVRLTLVVDDLASSPGTPLNWSITESIGWIECSVTSGSITNGGQQEVEVVCDRSSLVAGYYEGTFVVSSDSGSAVVTVRCIRTCAAVIVE